jgi:hypothetical protein
MSWSVESGRVVEQMMCPVVQLPSESTDCYGYSFSHFCVPLHSASPNERVITMQLKKLHSDDDNPRI